MLSLRMHVVMGNAAVSLWCSSHGPEHCIHRSSRWLEADTHEERIAALRDFAAHCYHLAEHGALEELTDECGW